MSDPGPHPPDRSGYERPREGILGATPPGLGRPGETARPCHPATRGPVSPPAHALGPPRLGGA
eukprot:11166193-Lingulodinium_polyedra.AAC.1